jgi:hypothetical protein
VTITTSPSPSATVPATESQVVDPLQEHVDEIRRLGKRVVSDIIEIGRRLIECKKIVGHGGWLPLLEREFGWTDDTALNFMRVFEMSKSRNFRDLSLPMSGLYLLAAPSTPEEVQQQVIERAEAGQRFSHAQIKEVIADAKAASKPNQHQPDDDAQASAELRTDSKDRQQPAHKRGPLDWQFDDATGAATADSQEPIASYRITETRIKRRSRFNVRLLTEVGIEQIGGEFRTMPSAAVLRGQCCSMAKEDQTVFGRTRAD